MLFTSLLFNVFEMWQTNVSSSDIDLKNWLVNWRLNFAHIFSAGFSSGLYGGRKMRTMLAGIFNDLALWKAPLSKTISFNSFSCWRENWSRDIWKVFPLQLGSSIKKLSPVMGEKAPNKYVDRNTCWNLQIGFTPLAVRVLPALVKRPNLLSSWKYRFIEVYSSTAKACASWQIWAKFF